MALQNATKSDKDSFAVTNTGHSASLRAKSFLAHIGWNAPKREQLPATWNAAEKMLEVTLPAGFLKGRTSVGTKTKWQ